MNGRHYALALMLCIFAPLPIFALTLYSVQSGTWGPGGTPALFNTAQDGSGVAYDGSSTLWQGSGTDVVIQSGHTIVFRHNSFTVGKFIIETNAKVYSNDIVSASNYIIEMNGNGLSIQGELGNGIPADPADADRIGLSINNTMAISGAGVITVRELNWDYTQQLDIQAIVNVHLYDSSWETWYLYPGFGTTNAADLNILTDGELNIYGNFTHDYDLRFAPGVATNASDITGKINVDGTLAVYEGNFLMKTDNSANQDFNVLINTDGVAKFNQYLYCNRGSGDPSPYLGGGRVALSVSGKLETSAADPIQYSSPVSLVSMRSGSTFKVSGAANQVIDADIDGGFFHNVELAGTGPKILDANVSISNNLIFTDCGLQLNNFNLTMSKTFALGTTNDVFQNSSETKFIETNGTGSVKAHVPQGWFLGPGMITWPIGNSTYNELAFENYGAADFMSIKVENQVLTNGATGSPITSLVVQKTWNIKEDVVGGQNLNITYMWNNADESTDFNRMDCWGSHHDGSSWDVDPQGTGAAAISGSYYTRRRNGVLNFSPFAIFSNAAILPVELLNFEGKILKENVALSWSTATEIDNKHFIIEHSTDAKTFQDIGTVEGAGNSTNLNSYNFTHYNPINGLNYYRLRQVDFSGDFEYSALVAVEMKDISKQLSIYPTLASVSLNCNFGEPLSTSASLEVFNSSGLCALRESLPTGEIKRSLDISSLNTGTYWLILKTKNSSSKPIQFFKK